MPNSPKQCTNEFSITNTLSDFGIAKATLKKLQLSAQANLVVDSRKIQKNDIFCAVIGHKQDGRSYIEKAVKLGAKLILSECLTEQEHGQISFVADEQVAVVQFYQLNQQLFSLAKAYYLQPQDKITTIGVTGTNGKTSTCQLIAKAFDVYNQSAAVIGTTGAGKVEQLQPIENTTPNAVDIHKFLHEFVNNGITVVAMEASSHGLMQQRVKAELFDIAVFTNLTRDHLDYHENMASYAEAKKQIFTQSLVNGKEQIAVLNGDDAQAQQWLRSWPNAERVWLFGRNETLTKHPLHVVAHNIQHQPSGVSFLLKSHRGEIHITSALLGDFNVDNLLATIAVLLIKNIPLIDIAKVVQGISPIVGRMESTSKQGLATAVVDYAHTPDALENALHACREHCEGELWTVFGCGGDRDKGKRALMGKVAENNADKIVLTNDNPRSESAEQIIKDILSGCAHPENITINLNREQAVLATLAKAKAEDIVLLAGKGHEQNIIIGDEIIAYDERSVVENFYQREVSV